MFTFSILLFFSSKYWRLGKISLRELDSALKDLCQRAWDMAQHTLLLPSSQTVFSALELGSLQPAVALSIPRDSEVLFHGCGPALTRTCHFATTRTHTELIK